MRKKSKSLDDYLVESGQIFITGDIDENTYIDISQQLRYMFAENISPRIYINSGGGNLEDALAIIDEFTLFERANREITTIAIGQACSASALILGYGSKMRRFATENAALMLHPISYSLLEGEHQSAKSYVTFADEVYKNTMTQLAMRCGRKNSKEINKFINDIRDGKWMNVDSAIEFGLIDAKWDYSLEKT